MRPPPSDLQIDADVVRADQPRILQPVARQHEDRRDMPRAERPGLLQCLQQGERRALGGERGVDVEHFLVLQAEDVGGGALLEEGAQRAEPVALDRDAGRHGVAAALDEQPLGRRIAHQPSEIEAGDRAA